MEREETAARGVRLPVETWRRIDEAAAELGMKSNEYLRRRLTGIVQRESELQNTHGDVHDTVEVGP
jgi:hypothetical protein